MKLQEQYCREHSRDDGFIYCEDCFWSDACPMGEGHSYFEYCCDFMFAPREVQDHG